MYKKILIITTLCVLFASAILFYFLRNKQIEKKGENAPLIQALTKLKKAYPDHIATISDSGITWTDGKVMAVNHENFTHSLTEKYDRPSLADQLLQDKYTEGLPNNVPWKPESDPGRIRYEPFFNKLYGSTRHEVEKNIVSIEWMPRIFGKKYKVKVTRLHNIADKVKKISNELEELVLENPSFKKYLDQPGGGYCWRYIAGTHRRSPHSYGIALDINPAYSHYWHHELKKRGQTLSELVPLSYQNSIPWQIVLIFEKYGFIWGGKWYHYDTMHFEYRPELISSCVT